MKMFVKELLLLYKFSDFQVINSDEVNACRELGSIDTYKSVIVITGK